MLTEQITSWAPTAVGVRAQLISIKPLHAWRENPPVLMSFDDGGHVVKAILSVAPAEAPIHSSRAFGAKIVAALALAEKLQLPAPRLIAADLEGTVAGTPMMLLTFLPGSSTIPAAPSTARLRAFGAAAASLRAVRPEPTSDLPQRPSGIDIQHAAEERRRAMRFETAASREQAMMLDEVCAATGCDRDKARHRITARQAADPSSWKRPRSNCGRSNPRKAPLCWCMATSGKATPCGQVIT